MPQAILLQDVETLGERGTVVDVSAGYLRNYLQPRKLAEPATDTSIKVAQRRQEDAERALREAEERSRESASVLGRTVRHPGRARAQDRPPQDPPGRADSQHRHVHGGGGDRRRSDGGGQDHGRRRLAWLLGAGESTQPRRTARGAVRNVG
jgi:hypothetical protein